MRPLLTLLLLALPCLVWSQTDSLSALHKLDSLDQSFTKAGDSIKNSYQLQQQKILSVKNQYLNAIALKKQRLDSIKGANASQKLSNPLDTLNTTQEITHYKNKIDSLDQQLESAEQRTASRIDSLKNKVNTQLGKLKLPKEAQGKADALTNKMQLVNVPAFNNDLATKLNLPNANGGLPTVSGMNTPRLNLPSMNQPVPGLPNAGLSNSLPDVKNNLSGDLSTDKVNDLTGQAGEIQKQVKDATGSTEGLEKAVETKAAEQLKDLPQQKLPAVEGLPDGIPTTSKDAQQQVVTMAKKEAVNHFTGKEQVLMGAIDKMSKYKQKYNSVNSLKEIDTKKNHNELKGKPLRERLVPAITWQFQSWRDLMLDINPSIGYKFSSHFTGGIGWNQRVAFNVPDRQFNQQAKVYGIRAYSEFELKKGFGFRLDIETMNTPAKQLNQPTDVAPSRSWVWGALVGIKQRYPIYKKLKGNAQLMYNVFDKDHQSPYTDRVNFRIGLEFTFKKKKQATPQADTNTK